MALYKTQEEVMDAYKAGSLTMSEATAAIAKINSENPAANRTRKIQMNASGGVFVTDPTWLVTSKSGTKYVASINVPFEVAEKLFALKDGKPSDVFVAVSKWLGEQTPETVFAGVEAAAAKKRELEKRRKAS